MSHITNRSQITITLQNKNKKINPFISETEVDFRTFTLQTNASTNHNGFAGPMLCPSPQTLTASTTMTHSHYLCLSNCPTNILKYVQNRPRYNFNSSTKRRNSPSSSLLCRRRWTQNLLPFLFFVFFKKDKILITRGWDYFFSLALKKFCLSLWHFCHKFVLQSLWILLFCVVYPSHIRSIKAFKTEIS